MGREHVLDADLAVVDVYDLLVPIRVQVSRERCKASFGQSLPNGSRKGRGQTGVATAKHHDPTRLARRRHGFVQVCLDVGVRLEPVKSRSGFLPTRLMSEGDGAPPGAELTSYTARPCATSLAAAQGRRRGWRTSMLAPHTPRYAERPPWVSLRASRAPGAARTFGRRSIGEYGEWSTSVPRSSRRARLWVVRGAQRPRGKAKVEDSSVAGGSPILLAAAGSTRLDAARCQSPAVSLHKFQPVRNTHCAERTCSTTSRRRSAAGTTRRRMSHIRP